MKKYSGIRQRGADSYEVNFRAFRGAPRITKNIKASSKQEASLKRAELIAEAMKEKAAPTPASRDKSTFEDIWPVIERSFIASQLAHKTKLGLRRVYDRMFIDFRQSKYPHITSPSQLSLPFFEEYKSYYGVEMNRPKGLRAEMQRVKVIMGRIRRLRFCSEDVMRDLSEVPVPAKNTKAYPEVTNTAIRVIMAKIKAERPDMYGPLYFMLRTGRRVQETTLIERKDITWDGFNPVKINIRAETTKKKVAAPLTCLDQDLMTHVRYYYQLNNKHKAPYLFLNKWNRKMISDKISRFFGNLSMSHPEINVRLTAHYLRHRLMTEACKEKLPFIDIMAITGIKDLKTLITYYSHSSQEGQASVLEKTRI